MESDDPFIVINIIATRSRERYLSPRETNFDRAHQPKIEEITSAQSQDQILDFSVLE